MEQVKYVIELIPASSSLEHHQDVESLLEQLKKLVNEFTIHTATSSIIEPGTQVYDLI